MKYFKVKTGFNADDYITIDETEVGMATRAQISGKVAIFKEGTIAGNNIISILPDWNKVMGWKRDYKLTGEDYEYIGEKTVNEYRDFQQLTNTNAQRQLQGLPELPKLEKGKFDDDIKSLSDKMKI